MQVHSICSDSTPSLMQPLQTPHQIHISCNPLEQRQSCHYHLSICLQTIFYSQRKIIITSVKHIQIFIPFIASTYIVEREILSIILNFKPCENVIIPLSAFPLEHNFIILQNLCKFWPFHPTLLSVFLFLLTEVARYINGQKILVQLELCLHFCFSVNLVCNRDQKDKPRLELQVKG